MKIFLRLSFAAFLLSTSVFAQQPQIGTSLWAAQHSVRTRNVAANNSVQNGNATLGMIYDTTACGLNFQQASLRLGQRFTPAGITQPAAFPIGNLPFCAQIDKAYIWCVDVGNGPAINVTVTNPVGTTTTFPMTMIGMDVDMCWGATGTYAYRADITSIINGNGNYMISGLPTTTVFSSTTNDIDGATMMVIYNDVSASYTGSIRIDDGCKVTNGGVSNYTMSGLTPCGNSTSATAFMVMADLQMNGATWTMNSGPTNTTTSFNWWDYFSTSTSVPQTQTSCNYSLNASGDCDCLAMTGLYTRTACTTCNPMSSVLTANVVSTTPASCVNNGAATISVSGGSGNYTINWNTSPQQSGYTATNLPAGTYYVSVTDSTASACTGLSVTIPYTGPVLSVTSTGVNCSTLGSASVSVTGGTGPYTYSWAPTGGTNSTANNLPAGVYTVTVTDNTGCSISATDTVHNNTSLIVNTASLPDTCPSPTGKVFAFVSGGTSPYTYLWQPGNQTTSSVSNLTAGSYTVTVTDAVGCAITSQVSVNTVNVPMTVSASIVGGSFSCLDSVYLAATPNYTPTTFVWAPPANLNNSTSQNPHALVIGNVTYTVTATSQCGTATDSITVSVAGSNTHNEPICFVSVDTAINHNVVIWERTNSPAAGSYNIYRESSVAGVYNLIGSQPITQFSTFTDMTSNPLQMASRYEITTSDSCGAESDTSAHHRTLFLQVSPSISGGYNLIWTPYEGLNIATYDIYRGSTPGNMNVIAAVPGTIFNFTDGAPPAGPIYYCVVAVHPTGGCNPSRLSQQAASTNGSLSNIGLANGVGIDAASLMQNSMSITPNPNDGNFQLNIQILNSGKIEVKVFDAIGQIAYEKTENAGAGIFTEKMDLSSLAKGVYMVQVKTEKGIVVKRLVIE
ncbi:MAG: T9SS type A sorting domain-containing protein [Bacteroidetes bacterium]|nr:T9SS type A sorting domain-containing protein [Bacteroidota bacterium]